MITGPRSAFEFRCHSRGYAMDEVRECIVSEDGDTITVDETHPSYPATKKVLPEYPRDSDPLSFAQKARNFATATARHVAAGAPRCTDEQVAARYAICQACEFLKNGECVKCGCPIVRKKKFISKLSWADQGCPERKWGPVT